MKILLIYITLFIKITEIQNIKIEIINSDL